MAKYIDQDKVAELVAVKNQIFAARNKAFIDHGIDILSNDIMSNLCIYEIVSKYDPYIQVNFARNGEDAVSGQVQCEFKTSRVNRADKPAAFMFHAMGDLAHERYIFAVRHRDDLELIRLYDISDPDHVAYIFLELWVLRDEWLSRGQMDAAKMKRDVIQITEDLITKQFTTLKKQVILGCEVYRD